MLTVVDYDGDSKFLIKDYDDNSIEEYTVSELKHIICDLGIKIVGLTWTGENNSFTVKGFNVQLDRPYKKKFGRWYVIVTSKGERYGSNLKRKHTVNTVVFYDTDVDWDKYEYPYGQHVTSYNLDTVLGVNGRLCLDFSIPTWTVSAEDMREIKDWLLRAKLVLG